MSNLRPFGNLSMPTWQDLASKNQPPTLSQPPPAFTSPHNIGVSGYVDGPHRNSPTQYGGQVSYTHVPTESAASVAVHHTHKFGTDVAAAAKLNVYQNPSTTVDVSANHYRHIGGPAHGMKGSGGMIHLGKKF